MSNYEVESNGSGVYVYRVKREEVARFVNIDDAQVFMAAVNRPATPQAVADPYKAAIAAVDAGQCANFKEAALRFGLNVKVLTARNALRKRWSYDRVVAE